MFSSSTLFVGFSNCFTATQPDKGGDVTFKKVGYSVLDKYHKMLSKICWCSQRNRMLQALMALQLALLFPFDSWFQVWSHSVAAFVTNMQSDVQENLREKLLSLYFVSTD